MFLILFGKREGDERDGRHYCIFPGTCNIVEWNKAKDGEQRDLKTEAREFYMGFFTHRRIMERVAQKSWEQLRLGNGVEWMPAVAAPTWYCVVLWCWQNCWEFGVRKHTCVGHVQSACVADQNVIPSTGPVTYF